MVVFQFFAEKRSPLDSQLAETTTFFYQIVWDSPLWLKIRVKKVIAVAPTIINTMAKPKGRVGRKETLRPRKASTPDIKHVLLLKPTLERRRRRALQKAALLRVANRQAKTLSKSKIHHHKIENEHGALGFHERNSSLAPKNSSGVHDGKKVPTLEGVMKQEKDEERKVPALEVVKKQEENEEGKPLRHAIVLMEGILDDKHDNRFDKGAIDLSKATSRLKAAKRHQRSNSVRKSSISLKANTGAKKTDQIRVEAAKAERKPQANKGAKYAEHKERDSALKLALPVSSDPKCVHTRAKQTGSKYSRVASQERELESQSKRPSSEMHSKICKPASEQTNIITQAEGRTGSLVKQEISQRRFLRGNQNSNDQGAQFSPEIQVNLCLQQQRALVYLMRSTDFFTIGASLEVVNALFTNGQIHLSAMSLISNANLTFRCFLSLWLTERLTLPMSFGGLAYSDLDARMLIERIFLAMAPSFSIKSISICKLRQHGISEEDARKILPQLLVIENSIREKVKAIWRDVREVDSTDRVV